MKKALLSLLTLLAAIFFSSFVHSNVVFRDNFESQSTKKWDREFCCQHSLSFERTPQIENRSGSKAIRFVLKKHDREINIGKRAELALKSVPTKSEYTYQFSLFIPEKYRLDSSFEILAQWHGLPDVDLGETWRSPPLALQTRNGNFELIRNWDDKPVTINEQRSREIISLGKYTTGKWSDWKFHVKWSYESDGLIEVWQDEQPVFSKQGANTYNDQKGTYFKIGIYKPDWKYSPQKSQRSQRTVFYDDVIIYKGKRR